ncbi:MAG TPA: 4-hydroxy-tetrahydrodipicolinate synthase [Bacteroidia bacterium]|jgi:4-hydroxy-tetrahydrodipicolinate synthase|nr:4-hydroxy-tetrahydrodipicolinate synthase [Bacteroidia bacterium]
MSIHTKLKGTGVAIVTPFDSKGDVDFKGLTNLVNHLVKGKVEYLVVLGTTGESATLSKDEKKKVIEHVIKANKKRLPLVLGIGGNSTYEVIDTIKHTNLKEFDAILSVSPYYNKPSQRGIYEHYKAIAKSTSKSIILYNVPGRTASNINAETTLKLANKFKNIVAVKEASGNLEQCMAIIENKPKDFLVISGDDNLTLPLLACGADGVISVVANAFPKDFSEMVRCGLKENFAAARKLHYKTFEITQQLFTDGNPGGVKQVLNLMKVCGPHVRLPLVEPNEGVQKKLKELVSSYK